MSCPLVFRGVIASSGPYIRSIPMSDSKGSSDKAIGRPGEWREGRYQQAGKPVDQSVKPSPETAKKPPDIISTPVTKRDYEQPKPS
jgi:hypothetical protein